LKSGKCCSKPRIGVTPITFDGFGSEGCGRNSLIHGEGLGIEHVILYRIGSFYDKGGTL
jgi:hypothetical protein